MSASKRIIPGTNAILLNSDGTLLSQHKALVQPLTNTTGTFQVAQSDGSSVLIVDTVDKLVGINQSSPGAMLQIDCGTATDIGQIIKLAAAQTANALEVQDSTGNVEIAINEDGDLFTDRWLLQDTNTFVGVGVVGAGNLAHGAGNEGYYNTFFGYRSGLEITTGYMNNGFGQETLREITSGIENNGMGRIALRDCTTGNYNNAMGNGALLRLTTGSRNNAMGYNALVENLTGYRNNAMGYEALRDNTTGYQNNAQGMQALLLNTTGYNHTALGYRAGYNQTTGSGCVYIGNEVRGVAAESNRLYIANSNTTTPLIYGLFTGAGAGVTIHSQDAAGVPLIVKGIAGQTANALEVQDSTGAVLSGADERGILFSDGGTSIQNFFAGDNAGNIAASGGGNVAVGWRAGRVLSTGYFNVFLGGSSGYNNSSGYENFFLGENSGRLNVSGFRNVGLGVATMYNTTGNNNLAIGQQAMYYSSTGVHNVAVGPLALGAGTGAVFAGADNNVMIGFGTGYILGAGDSGNIFIGNEAGYRQTGISNRLLIDNQLRADAATELTHAILYGTMAANPEDQQLTINVDSLTVGTDADADVVVNFVANSNSGQFSWMEDEDYFNFADTLKTSAARIKSTTRIDSGDSPYTTTNTDDVIFADTDGGAITVNLQAGVDGRRLRIINCGSSGNDVTIDGDGAEEIRGELTQTLADGEILILVYESTEEWF